MKQPLRDDPVGLEEMGVGGQGQREGGGEGRGRPWGVQVVLSGDGNAPRGIARRKRWLHCVRAWEGNRKPKMSLKFCHVAREGCGADGGVSSLDCGK